MANRGTGLSYNPEAPSEKSRKVNSDSPILVTDAAGDLGGVGRTIVLKSFASASCLFVPPFAMELGYHVTW
jgi:hypothetical protein